MKRMSLASMRPPLNAGENAAARRPQLRTPSRFNEAPAERGGKRPGATTLQVEIDVASMRPPLNAGENDARHRVGSGAGGGFNEAPAERGGNWTAPPRGRVRGDWLQ